MSVTDPILTAQKDLAEGQRREAMGRRANGLVPDSNAILPPAAMSGGQASAGTESLRGAETILLVDDEDAVRRLMVAVMEKYGYHLLQAATGEEALDVWKRHHSEIKVLVTDMVMPGDLNGWELAQQLLDVQPELKVVYTSGYDAKLAAEVFKITSEIIFLQKPYRAERLAAAVREALDSPAPANNPDTK